jgi:hypothetical protein
MKSALRTINIALIAVMMQKNNIQTIYFGINIRFVEDGVVMIQSITYVKPYEDKMEGAFYTFKLYKLKICKSRSLST